MLFGIRTNAGTSRSVAKHVCMRMSACVTNPAHSPTMADSRRSRSFRKWSSRDGIVMWQNARQALTNAADFFECCLIVVTCSAVLITPRTPMTLASTTAFILANDRRHSTKKFRCPSMSRPKRTLCMNAQISCENWRRSSSRENSVSESCSVRQRSSRELMMTGSETGLPVWANRVRVFLHRSTLVPGCSKSISGRRWSRPNRASNPLMCSSRMDRTPWTWLSRPSANLSCPIWRMLSARRMDTSR
mmetsp:Transcript_130135/g.224984  ORF Transcript_130135/g.224984 Transcript_130135/m.224984 type:complete len:246 (+) Transcript_130135:649-1386(+)